MRPPPTVLLAFTNEEDASLLDSLIHRTFSCASQQVDSAAALRNCLKQQAVRVLLIDLLFLPADETLRLIGDLRLHHPELLILPVIPESRRDLLKQTVALDIFDFLNRPFRPQEISLTLQRAAAGLLAGQAAPSEGHGPGHSCQGIIGRSESMQRLFDLIAKVAADDSSTVLIRGESGTGKELVAKAIHVLSRRSDRNFVPVNCAAIPDDLLESELFGYTKGAFTGAASNKQGRIQYADGGTLFLDEIGDMKSSLQAKLLRVLQEKEFEPVGAFKAIPVDTRILAATHCDLEQMVREGRFREDLYYRLSVIPISIAPLKERREDIPLLIESFIETFTVKRGRAPFTLSPQAISALMHYEWKGNVRELENLIQHMSVLYGGRMLELCDLPEKFHHLAAAPLPPDLAEHGFSPASFATAPAVASRNPSFSLEDGPVDFNAIIGELETELIVAAMRIAAGNKKEAARLLSLKRTTLLEKIKKKELGRLWGE